LAVVTGHCGGCLGATVDRGCAPPGAFVTLVQAEDFVYSCGMHNLGLPDASVTAELGAETCARTISAFNHQQLIHRPPLAAAAAQDAASTLSYFLRVALHPFEYGTAMIKVRLVDGEHSANMWLLFEGVDGDVVRGTVFELPPEFSSFRVGQALRVGREQILDWAIIRSGTLIGGYTIRLTRSLLDGQRAREHDLHMGIASYAPLEELPRG
jgi:uncharacterized protein YegJ (DUF2314 family)